MCASAIAVTATSLTKTKNMNNQEILDTATKNAEYILKLEIGIDERNKYIRQLRTALNHALAFNEQAYELLSPKYEKEFEL
jgi:hypothetical protein